MHVPRNELSYHTMDTPNITTLRAARAKRISTAPESLQVVAVLNRSLHRCRAEHHIAPMIEILDLECAFPITHFDGLHAKGLEVGDVLEVRGDLVHKHCTCTLSCNHKKATRQGLGIQLLQASDC